MPETRWAQAVDGASIAYQDIGEGPITLVLIHGWISHLEIYYSGEVETIDGKAGGIAVNIGARVGSIAQPSEVLVSQTVKDLVAGSGLAFEDAGEHDLKGVPERWRLYRAATR